jgi:hypothetical protein
MYEFLILFMLIYMGGSMLLGLLEYLTDKTK